MPTRRFLWIVLGVLAACGGEEVNLSTLAGDASSEAGPVDDATVSDASADASVETSTDSVPDAPSDLGDGRAFGGGHRDAAGCVQCSSDGVACRFPTDCCSNRCESGYCLPGGTCQAPGAACSARSECCSNRCEPRGPSGALICTPFCGANGASCDSAASCCSLACNAGTCGGTICRTAGTSCSNDSDCCGGRCDSDRCTEPPGSCFPSGEACGDDAGVNCCSGTCNQSTGRCDLGGGQCREMSAPCTQKGECCLGDCTFSAIEGVSVCTAPCLLDGKNCNSNADCCTGICAGAPPRCVSPGNFCGP